MEISRFSIIEFPRMHRVSDSAGPVDGSLFNAVSQCCLPLRTTRSASRIGDFGAQWLARAFPCQLLYVSPRGHPHMTRGHNGAASPFMSGSLHPQLYAGLSRRFRPVPPSLRSDKSHHPATTPRGAWISCPRNTCRRDPRGAYSRTSPVAFRHFRPIISTGAALSQGVSHVMQVHEPLRFRSFVQAIHLLQRFR